MLGRLLDRRYQIVQVLGSGGFGQTYIAEDTRRPGNPRCVLKHLNFTSQNAEILRQVRRMFYAEADTLERLGRHDQIPQLLAYFEEQQEFYLVQEFIEGHLLSDELSAARLIEAQVIELLEDVLHVLQFVHEQGVIHRDLKPENLIRRDRDHKLVLIDFGAVKTIETSIAPTQPYTQISVPVYTSGYAASEQCLGKPKFNSDLYSLGAIAIQALTGVRPSQIPQNPNTGEFVWRDQAVVSNQLASVIDRMTRFHFVDRYQTAKEVLSDLAAIKSLGFTQVPRSQIDATQTDTTQLDPTRIDPRRPTPRVRHPLKLAAVLGAVSMIGLSTWVMTRPKPPATVQQAMQPISFGETLMSPIATSPLKQSGIDQLKAGNFSEAVRLFQAARKLDRADPETLIYLNNARIGKDPAYTIAVVVPLRTQPQSSLEVLRGVAQAQDRLNQTKGIKLKVAIASDDSDPTLARQIAQQLVIDPRILGVIGHGSSDTTYVAGQVYQAGELVAISPVSSAKNLSGFSRYVFRTMPSDELPAKRLAAHMMTQLKKRKVAIFYNSANLYSRSLTEAFRDALYYGDRGKIVHEVDLSSPSFEGAESVQQSIKKGAEVILLAPNSELIDRALLVISANQKRLPILAGDALYGSRILTELGGMASGIVFAVPATQAKVENSPFEQQARSIWGRAVEWRSALGYDATQALIAALQKAPTRNGIRAVLSAPTFAADGAVYPVSFTVNGDRETAIALMRVTAVKGRYEFKPVK